MERFGIALAGEWSVAINDCGLCVYFFSLEHLCYEAKSKAASRTTSDSDTGLMARSGTSTLTLSGRARSGMYCSPSP